MIKKIILLLICFSCASDKVNLNLKPVGKGISSVTRNSSTVYFLETACKDNPKRFQKLISSENDFVTKTELYKKYNLEFIELYQVNTYQNPFEIKLTQSGCTDRVVSIDISYNTDDYSFDKNLKKLQTSFIELPFDKEFVDIKTDFQTALNLIGNNQKKYCKTDLNFVAYKKRVLCNIKHKGLYYQLLWGLIENQKPILSLTSSGTF